MNNNRKDKKQDDPLDYLLGGENDQETGQEASRTAQDTSGRPQATEVPAEGDDAAEATPGAVERTAEPHKGNSSIAKRGTRRVITDPAMRPTSRGGDPNRWGPEEFVGQCTAQAKHTKKRCQAACTPGRSVCHIHGGKTPRGIASPHFQGAGRSKDLPPQLKDRYDAAIADPELLSLRTEVALYHARIDELVGKLTTGETGDLWEKVQAQIDRLDKALAERPEDFHNLYLGLKKIVASGGDYKKAWAELSQAIDKKADVAGKEWKRQVDLHQVITMERAMNLIVCIMEAVRANVPDRRALSAIQQTVGQLMRANTGQGPPEGNEV